MPKRFNLSDLSQLQLNAIPRQLKERPRKTIGFHTPAQNVQRHVQYSLG